MPAYRFRDAQQTLDALLVRVGWPEIAKRLLSKGGRSYVLAGAVRDTLATSEFGLKVNTPRDLDIGVEGVPRRTFDDVCIGLGAEQNRFRGFRLELANNFQVDVWRLEDTVGLKRSGAPYSLSNVLRCFMLSCSAVAYDPERNIFADEGCVRSLEQKAIGFAANAIINSCAVFAAKAVVLGHRYDFTLTPETKALVCRHINAERLEREFKKAASCFLPNPERVNAFRRFDDKGWNLPETQRAALDSVRATCRKTSHR
jgi:hypothetical protein